MRDSAGNESVSEPGCPDEIQVLTFTMEGIKMGVDTEQIGGMAAPEHAEEGAFRVYPFHEKIPLRGGPVAYEAPRVLIIKDARGPYGIVIDRPDEITSIPIDSIRPLPSLIASCGGSKAIWGATVKDGDIVMLVDFSRLHLSDEDGRITSAVQHTMHQTTGDCT